MQSVVMVLLGAVLARIASTDVYLRYVQAGMRWYLLATAGVLLVVGLATLARDLWLRRGPDAGKHRRQPVADAGCGGQHGHGAGPRSAWLLVAPVLALVLIAPPSLGSFAANRAGTATALAETKLQKAVDKESAGKSMYPPIPAGDPVKLTMLDYAARAVFDKGISLQGRRITLTGFVSPGRGGTKYLTRMIMVCCAADSRPIKIGIKGRLGVSAHSDQWLELVGEYDSKQDVDELNQEKIPYVKVISARHIAAPENPYDI